MGHPAMARALHPEDLDVLLERLCEAALPG